MHEVKVAIHDDKAFAPRWKSAAVGLGIEFKAVDCYAPGLLEALDGCAALLWQIDHESVTDLKFSRSILQAVALRGVHVFPDHFTAWHFDDKVAQKYALEAVRAATPKTWVFFDQSSALDFIAHASFPLVFKLRSGAGSLNVQLVRDRRRGERLVRRMFAAGMRRFQPNALITRAIRRGRRSSKVGDNLMARGRRALHNLWARVVSPERERGYALFQEFIPGNDHDTRVTIIGQRAFVFTRGVRENDFRASGSMKDYAYLAHDEMPMDVVKESFRVAEALSAQSMCLDFVREPDSNEALLLEVNYSFVADNIEECPGYVGRDLEWVPGRYDPAALIMADLLKQAQSRR